MGYDNRNNSSGGRSRGGYGRRNDRSQSFKATCDKCGDDCTLPFKPTSNKPVYCSKCFETEGSKTRRGQGGRGNDRRDSGRGGFGRRDSRQSFDAVCDECGKDCKLPFKPTNSKPILCDSCFGKNGSSKKSSGITPLQYEELNAKLDKILELLGSESVESKEEAVEVLEEVTDSTE